MKTIPPNRIVASRPGGSEDYAGKEIIKIVTPSRIVAYANKA